MRKKIIFLLSVVGILLVSSGFLAFYFKDSSESFSFPLFNRGGKTKKKESEQEQVKSRQILFVGDMMWDRHIRLAAQEHGYDYVLQPLGEFLTRFDLVVANLEGPITSQPSVSVNTIPGEPNNFIFTFAPEVARILADNNIHLVNIGNNHILNFGQSGLQETVGYLEEAGIDYFGYTGQEETPNYYVYDWADWQIGLVNYNQFIAGSYQQVKEDIQLLAPQVDYLIVYTHWGEEYQAEPNNAIKDLAYELVKDGADLIIGSHPHVIQPDEDYQGSKIYYSLGNFVFDQYFSAAVRQGQLVALRIDSSGEITLRDYKVTMTSEGQTKLAE